jgi:hypothetical protein
MTHPVKLHRRIERHRQSLTEMHVLRSTTFTWFTLLNVNTQDQHRPTCARQGPAQQAVLREVTPKVPRNAEGEQRMKSCENCKISIKSLHEEAQGHITTQFGAIGGAVTVAIRWGSRAKVASQGRDQEECPEPAPQGTRTYMPFSP